MQWWRRAVVYEIYPRSFQDTDGDGVGDPRGVADRLPYLARLGVDAVWLTPFYASPMRDFGYDITDHLNWRNPDVRAAMLEVIRFWKARGVDGFRVDAMRQVLKDLSLRDNPPVPDWSGPPDVYASLVPDFTTDLDELQEVGSARTTWSRGSRSATPPSPWKRRRTTRGRCSRCTGGCWRCGGRARTWSRATTPRSSMDGREGERAAGALKLRGGEARGG